MDYHAGWKFLNSIKDLVMANYTDNDGSIMYLGSEDNKHYFKSKVTRKTIFIEKEVSLEHRM